MPNRKPYRHRFPLSIMGYAPWLYHRFPLSQQDVQELLQGRGIHVSHETLRQWNIKFAPLLTEELRQRGSVNLTASRPPFPANTASTSYHLRS